MIYKNEKRLPQYLREKTEWKGKDMEKCEKYLAHLDECNVERPERELFGVYISQNYGKSWRLQVLCVECVKNIEPPMMRRKGGSAASKNCDWCMARNIN